MMMEGVTVAAADMGTNTFHMIVARPLSQGRFCIVDSYKDRVRLGSAKVIDGQAEERALNAMQGFRRLLNAWNVNSVRIVATAAVREACNRHDFLAKVKDVSGFDVDVISGSEEARLTYLGVLQALPVYNKLILNVDIGGGSTEFALGYKGEIIYSNSLKLGHIRLPESILENQDGEINECQINEIRNLIHSTVADSTLVEKVREVGFQMVTGSSGTIKTIQQVVRKNCASVISDMCFSPMGSFQECGFTRDELDAVIKRLAEAKYDEDFAADLGFYRRPLASVVAGLILLQEIFGILGIDKMVASPYAIREGAITDMLSMKYKDSTFLSGMRQNSVMLVAWRFNDMNRVEMDIHSAHLARELLKGLQNCKENGHDCFTMAEVSIDNRDVELMEAAILLHRIGMVISYRGYHKHSYYMIKNLEDLHGFKPKELEFTALLARYHRKKFPCSKHDCLSKLPKEVQRKISSLSVVTRIAVSLGQSNCCSVQGLNVCYENAEYTIVVIPSVDPLTGSPRDVSSEIWAAQSERKHFEQVFKRKLAISVAVNVATC